MPQRELNGIMVHYEVYGDGFPFVLLHGFAGTTESWKPQIKSLSQNYKLILYDLRGHGQTDAPSQAECYSMDLVVDDLYQLLTHLGIEQAIIGGLSLGGIITMRFCLKYPHMASVLILADTGPGFRDQVRSNQWDKERLECATILETGGMNAFIQSSYAQDDYYTALETMRSLNPIGLANISRYVMSNLTMVPLVDIKSPTLLIVGQKDVNFLAATDYMAKHIPHSEKIVIPDAGHGVNIDQPENFNQVILDFLSRHGRGSPLSDHCSA